MPISYTSISHEREDAKNHTMSGPTVSYDGANYIYTTPYGEYAWIQPGNILRFKNHSGELIVEKSVYVLQYLSGTSWLPLLNFVNIQTPVHTDTQYRITYDVQYRWRGTNYIVGNVIINFDASEDPPKTNISFTKSVDWATVELTDFRWIWDVVPYVDGGFKYQVEETAVKDEEDNPDPSVATDITLLDIPLSKGSRDKMYFSKNSGLEWTPDDQWLCLNLSDNGSAEHYIGLETFWNSYGNVTIFSVNQANIDPEITYTSMVDSFSVTDGLWQDYDIYTNKGIPMGSVVEIACCNLGTGNEYYMGVRTDGSLLDRYILIHEAEGGGEVVYTMPVKVDSSTGYIEAYQGYGSSRCVFRILGYFTNCDFTEAWNVNSVSTIDVWTDLDLGTNGNRVHAVIITSALQDASFRGGIRTNESSLTRNILIHEPEGGGESGLMFYVKSDANDVIDYYISEGTSKSVIDTGYFGDTVDFEEDWTQLTNFVNNCWDPRDLFGEGLSGATGGYSYITLGTSIIRAAHRITFPSSIPITRVYFRFKKIGNPTGTLYATIRKASDDEILETSSDTVDVTSLTTDATGKFVSFSFTNSFSGDVRLSAEYVGGDVTNYIQAVFRYDNNLDGYYCYYNGTSWTSFTDLDLDVAAFWNPHDEIVSISLCNRSPSAQTEFGVRSINDRIHRIINIHEAESANGYEYTGYTITTQLTHEAIEIWESYGLDGIVIQGYFTTVGAGTSYYETPDEPLNLMDYRGTISSYNRLYPASLDIPDFYNRVNSFYRWITPELITTSDYIQQLRGSLLDFPETLTLEYYQDYITFYSREYPIDVTLSYTFDSISTFYRDMPEPISIAYELVTILFSTLNLLQNISMAYLIDYVMKHAIYHDNYLTINDLREIRYFKTDFDDISVMDIILKYIITATIDNISTYASVDAVIDYIRVMSQPINLQWFLEYALSYVTEITQPMDIEYFMDNITTHYRNYDEPFNIFDTMSTSVYALLQQLLFYTMDLTDYIATASKYYRTIPMQVSLEQYIDYTSSYIRELSQDVTLIDYIWYFGAYAIYHIESMTLWHSTSTIGHVLRYITHDMSIVDNIRSMFSKLSTDEITISDYRDYTVSHARYYLTAIQLIDSIIVAGASFIQQPIYQAIDTVSYLITHTDHYRNMISSIALIDYISTPLSSMLAISDGLSMLDYVSLAGALYRTLSQPVETTDYYLMSMNVTKEIIDTIYTIASLSYVSNINRTLPDPITIIDYFKRIHQYSYDITSFLTINTYLNETSNTIRTFYETSTLMDYKTIILNYIRMFYHQLNLILIVITASDKIKSLLQTTALLDYNSTYSEWLRIASETMVSIDWISRVMSFQRIWKEPLTIDTILSHYCRKYLLSGITQTDYINRVGNWTISREEPIGLLYDINTRLFLWISMIDNFSLADSFNRTATWIVSTTQSTSLWTNVIVPIAGDMEELIIYYYGLISGN